MFANKKVQNAPRNIVFVLPKHPWPIYAGQTRLAFNRARELQNQGYNVSLFSFSSQSLDPRDIVEIRDAFYDFLHVKIAKRSFLISFAYSLFKRFLYGAPLQVNTFNSRAVKKKFIDFMNAYRPDNTNIHFYSIRSAFLWTLADGLGFKQVRDLVDSMTLNIDRKLSVKSAPLMKCAWNYELHAIRNFEQSLPCNCLVNVYLCVSPKDLSFLNPGQCRKAANGVGVRLDSVRLEPRMIAKNDNFRILFFGSLYYEPNQSAIKWLIDNVCPLLSKDLPEYSISFAGCSPPQWLKNICANSSRLKLISDPPDMKEVLLGHDLVVAPLVSGSGQQFKIIESMAEGFPVVTTSIGAKPFNLEDGNQCMIGDAPEDFAKAIIKVLNDPRLYEKLSKNGLLLVNKDYTWSSLVLRLLRDQVYNFC